MPLRFKYLIKALVSWEWILSISIELLLRLLFVGIWNFCTSETLNKFLFGTSRLEYFPGLILISALIFLLSTGKKSVENSNLYTINNNKEIQDDSFNENEGHY